MKQPDPSMRRFRVRLSVSDHSTLEHLLTRSGHRTRAAVVRAALTLYQRLIDAQVRDGMELVLVRRDTQELQPADLLLLPAFDRSHPADHTPAGFLELRLTPGEVSRFEHIEQVTDETVWADILRRALESYRITCDWFAKGYQPAARTGHGDLVDLWHIELMPRAAAFSGKTGSRSGRTKGPRRSAETTTGGLPRDLAEGLAALAHARGVRPEELLAELVRRELDQEPKATTASPPPSESTQVPFTFFDSGLRRATAHREEDGVPELPIETPTSEGPAPDTMLVPVTHQESWALVLACDTDGNPDKQVVQATSVVPLEDEDLEGFAGYEDPFLW